MTAKPCKKCGGTAFYESPRRCKACIVRRVNAYWADPKNRACRQANNQRARLVCAMSRQGVPAPRNLFALVGCSAAVLLGHIEGLMLEKGMTWNGYPKEWNLDHEIPLGSLNLGDPHELARGACYKNLRPLWAEEHRAKTAREIAEARARRRHRAKTAREVAEARGRLPKEVNKNTVRVQAEQPPGEAAPSEA